MNDQLQEETAYDLVLYNLWDSPTLPFPVEPCTSARDWVKTAGGGPYRCLPLKLATEAGWAILSPMQFTAVWNGSNEVGGITVSLEGGDYFECVSSHFGLGVLTFNFPYLFRTPENINLWVRGPANWPRDGIQPLEGIVETDWTEAKFTMNWKFTRPHQPIQFQIGDPICVIVPYPRYFLERFVPRTTTISADPELKAAYDTWRESRQSHLFAQETGQVNRRVWQKTYYKGLTQEGEPFAHHQVNLKAASFRPIGEEEPPPDRS